MKPKSRWQYQETQGGSRDKRIHRGIPFPLPLPHPLDMPLVRQSSTSCPDETSHISIENQLTLHDTVMKTYTSIALLESQSTLIQLDLTSLYDTSTHFSFFRKSFSFLFSIYLLLILDLMPSFSNTFDNMQKSQDWNHFFFFFLHTK